MKFSTFFGHKRDAGMGLQQIVRDGVQPTDWFRSYVSNRKQIVNTNGVESDPLANSCGVPQGSVLGLLLFLCYVNDMPNSTSCLMLQYADDSALIYSDNDPEKISNVLRVTWKVLTNG